MRKGAPGVAQASVQQRVVKELKTNWWLWGSIVFAVLLVGSLVVFRENLYDSAKHGLPFLAGQPTYIHPSCLGHNQRPPLPQIETVSIVNLVQKGVPTRWEEKPQVLSRRIAFSDGHKPWWIITAILWPSVLALSPCHQLKEEIATATIMTIIACTPSLCQRRACLDNN